MSQTFGELARRHRAAAVSVAAVYDRTLEEILASPQLCAVATSVYIEANRSRVPLADRLRLDRRLVVVNGQSRKENA